jgi:hypothetical protein
MSSREDKNIKVKAQGFGLSDAAKIPIDKGTLEKIIVKDKFGKKTQINVKIEQYDFGSKRILLYASSIVVNESPYELVFMASNVVERFPLGGLQPFEGEAMRPVFLMTQGEELAAAFQETPDNFSRSVPTQVVGASVMEVKRKSTNEIIEFGVNVQIHCVGKRIFYLSSGLEQLKFCLHLTITKITKRFCTQRLLQSLLESSSRTKRIHSSRCVKQDIQEALC